MFGEDKLPGAWAISMALYDRESDARPRTGPRRTPSADDSEHSNLVLVQFAQFVEHDMSKPVSQSMSKKPYSGNRRTDSQYKCLSLLTLQAMDIRLNAAIETRTTYSPASTIHCARRFSTMTKTTGPIA